MSEPCLGVALVTPGGYEPHLLAGQHALKAKQKRTLRVDGLGFT